jgi:hypothetical protein
MSFTETVDCQHALELGSVKALKKEVDCRGWTSPERMSRRNKPCGGRPFSAGNLRCMLQNRIYHGQIAHKGIIYEGQHPALIDDQVWQSVQHQIACTLQIHRTRQRKVAPTLLVGLVVNDDGRKFTTDHANKKGRRYRYYVGPRPVGADDTSSPRTIRIPADELEGVVIDSLTALLQDESRVRQLIGKHGTDEVQQQLEQATSMAQRLSGTTASDKIDVLRTLREKLTVYTDHIELTVRGSGLGSSAGSDPGKSVSTVISIPVKVRRSGIAMRLVIRPTSDVTSRGPDPKLGALLAKAHDWFSRLASGRYDGVQAIATEEKVTSSYATRVIYVALMAPDLALRILSGDHPRALNASQLLSLMPLPEHWEDQRQVLGM